MTRIQAAVNTQTAAMAKTKISLRQAVGKVLSANKGFRAVSAFPELKDGHSIAVIEITDGKQVRSLTEPLG